jgi:non-lysosomal glucosylceramidase
MNLNIALLLKSKWMRLSAIGLIVVFTVSVTAYLFLMEASPETAAPVQIPSEAWSRDISAGTEFAAESQANVDGTLANADTVQAGTESYIDGAPVGGLGAGSITWRYDGNFYDGRLKIGKNEMDIDENCGFYLYQKPHGQDAEVCRLDAASIGPDQARYYSLFPKSWVDYYGSKFICKAKVTQFSPVIPGDYQRSSYPVAIYYWQITNPTDTKCDVSIMLTWENDFGGTAVIPAGSSGEKFAGIRLLNAADDEPPDRYGCEFSLGCEKVKGVKITYASSADVNEISADLAEDGSLNNRTGEDSTGAVCVTATLGPGQVLGFPMVLSWDMPVVESFKDNDWYREYTRYFGRTGTNSWNVAREALANAKAWEGLIDNWQRGILDNATYPGWLKTMLFNELYYYFAGGTVWEAGAASGQPDDPEEDMFGSLECYDFPYYGTSDVRFYGSWALLELWPEIEKQCVKQFCDSVYNTREDRPKALGTTAHDFGQYGRPFQLWNAYNYRDSRNWKDLNSKLVLMVYRDWALTGKKDTEFLNYCRIPVQTAMEKVGSQDANGDGLPDSSGIDQTYDNMSLKGDTAYCGGLFLAACEAAGEMAKAVGDEKRAAVYKDWLDKGQKTYETKLWNGSYYNIDTGSENPSRIMSDQLCGQWYSVACGLPGIVPDSSAAGSFFKLFDYNFKKFDGGTHGIVNVMLPSGEIDTDSSQSSECWVGTNWGVVAGMVQQGMTDEADEIGRSLYDTIWNSGQLWFRTPEAWQTGLTGVRSPYYMRATAIWAVKHAFDLKR